MSIHYTLYLGADRSPQEVMTKVGRGLGLDLGSGLESEAIPGLVVAAKKVGRPTDQFIREDHGFTPKVEVYMGLDKEDLRTAESGVVDLLSVFAKQCASDAVLLRQDETVAYRRVGGESEVAESDPIWADPKHLGRLTRTRRGSIG